MNARTIRALGAASVFLIGGSGPVLSESYTGQETRAIAALSEADTTALLQGEGWGFAKPAELNGYPGPAHVLELSEELGLSAGQLGQIEGIEKDMRVNAKRLGAEMVAAEQALDFAFAEEEIDAERLVFLTGEAGRARSELRAVHLAAHLEVTPLLTRHQIMMYNQLRGYGGGHEGHGSH